MKIHRLEINHVRGIPDLKIAPTSKSLVIYGPNGSGKSAVIDALDFLLTGKIARLSGEGTEGVSLKEHGPHIDKVADLSNVEVKAEIELHAISETIEVSRKMSNPNELVFDSKYNVQLAPIIELLNRGQYVFTRREVLKLITAKSSTRLQEIQKVLKLKELEDIRANLVKINTETNREFNKAKDVLNKGKQDVLAITGQVEYNQTEVLNFINDQRTKLGGTDIDTLESKKLQQGITGVKTSRTSINHKNLSERISNLKSEEVKKVATKVEEADNSLRLTMQEIREDPLASWNSKRYSFTEHGINLIRGTGECPLCDKKWPNGELQQYLHKRIESESARQTRLTENAKINIECANAVKIRIQQVTELVKHLAESDNARESNIFTSELQILNKWSDYLTSFTTALTNPMENYKDDEVDADDVKKLYTPDKIDTNLDEFENEVKKLFPEATSEQTAWDNLTKLVERIKIIEEGQVALDHTVLAFNRATVLVQAYVAARNEILENLYDKIKARFVGLYKEMHGDDEKGFDATFVPQDAGLNLEVDFYGRGLHPPHAMHSEGHQDSMGVCLFLALSEHLNTGLIDLIILDDVVMSVDIGHRRAFCSVLINNFPDKQFIITTHDTAWANQLKSVGLIPGKQMLKFSNWDVDSGPVVHYEADMWGRIQVDLDNDDVPSASAKLRRGMEEFARYVCHSLRASVPYTIDDAGNLGDFLPAAIGRYKELLSKAKEAANSWNQTTIMNDLKTVNVAAKEIIKKTSVEQWNINRAVHYNKWANFEKDDFTPVIEAFKELYESVFSCSQEECQAVLQVNFDGAKVNGVRCKCGAINWNLNKR